MALAKPVARQTHGVGFTAKHVIVDEVLVERNVARCRDLANLTPIEVMLLPMRVRMPNVGEKWLIDRTFGGWSFAALLAAPDIEEVGRSTPHFGPTPPPGDATTWRIGQQWVETPVKYWDGTQWSTTAP